MLITFSISLNKDCGNDLPIRRTGATLAGLKWDFHRTPHMSAHVPAKMLCFIIRMDCIMPATVRADMDIC